MRTILILTLLVATSRPAAAEVQQLWESPAASVSQHLGLTEIKIDYHRPAVKGRVVWGQLVPYAKVWRTGANDATTISFSTPVRVAGKDVPAGTYALFAVPEKDRFTFILNKNAQQWGSYFYKAEDDQLRFEVKIEPAPHKEWLEYQLELKDRVSASAVLHWEKLRVSFPIEAEVDRIYRAHLTTSWPRPTRRRPPRTAGVRTSWPPSTLSTRAASSVRPARYSTRRAASTRTSGTTSGGRGSCRSRARSKRRCRCSARPSSSPPARRRRATSTV